jgi:hypothetical protein
MSTAAHQSAIHWLLSQKCDPLMQAQVDAYVRQHERECRQDAEEEMASSHICQPCNRKCSQSTCPASQPNQ